LLSLAVSRGGCWERFAEGDRPQLIKKRKKWIKIQKLKKKIKTKLYYNLILFQIDKIREKILLRDEWP